MNKQKQHTIKNVIACQIGDNTYIVQGKRLTENKLRELYLLSSKVMQKQGIIKGDYKSQDPRPCINYIKQWLVKGDLELFTDRTALLNDSEIDNIDTIFYSSKVNVVTHPVIAEAVN